MEISLSALFHACCLIMMTCPWALFTSNGAVSTNSSPLAFSFEPRPIQAHWGPHPPSEIENTRSLPRKNMKAKELSGETRARQSPFRSSAESGTMKRLPSTATTLIENDHFSQRPIVERTAQRVLPFKSVMNMLISSGSFSRAGGRLGNHVQSRQESRRGRAHGGWRQAGRVWSVLGRRTSN